MSSWSKIAIRVIDQKLNNIGLNLTHPMIFRDINPFQPYKYQDILQQPDGERLTKCHFIDYGALPSDLVYAGLINRQLTIMTIGMQPHMFIQKPFVLTENLRLNETLCDIESKIPNICFDIKQPDSIGNTSQILTILRANYMVIDKTQYFTNPATVFIDSLKD